MPAEDVSDLKDVVDAINRLCDTMKASDYEDELYEDCAPADESVATPGYVECTELVSPGEVTVRTVETYRAERCSEGPVEEPPSEMYYTASSEVSLSDLDLPERVHEHSDERGRVHEHSDERGRVHEHSDERGRVHEHSDERGRVHEHSDERGRVHDDSDERGREECVMAGHVAAMRERFESMTRANTPCPELVRSSSPSLDVFRDITPPPDRLG